MNAVPNPLLLVDIDGVIALFGFDADGRPPGAFLAVEGIVHYLSARAGEHLRRLADRYELAWCSGWEEKANEYLRPALDLPAELPHLCFERRPGTSAHWKLGAIDAYAGTRRPLAWIDDAHDEETAAWARARPGPTLIVPTHPPVGLTDADVARLLDWAGALESTG
jgi:hypothetical protein